MKQAVFIERDGILNQVRIAGRSQVPPMSLAELRPNFEAAPGLQTLKDAGFLVIATTNQPGLSRGDQSRRELDMMHDLLRARFPLDDILVCPHDEIDQCPCRKPQPGLLIEAAYTWHLSLDQCFVVSDKWQDAGAARLVGCTSLVIDSPWAGNGHRDFRVCDFEQAVEKILQVAAMPYATV